jgi:ectoine hydroxylase-related dioxygenase (phytanoyl-CoA dioxygenase family)
MRVEAHESLRDEVETRGFAILDKVVNADLIERAVNGITNFGAHAGVQAGVRQIHQSVPEVADVINSAEVQQIVSLLLRGAFVVRSVFFDKTPDANWKVSWHQDLTICVERRLDVEGFSAWSLKSGVVHVQPPVEVLERMVTLRFHLDDCFEDNGPLQVISESHKHGRLSAQEISEWQRKSCAATCLVHRGGIVAMKPLLLHSSSPAREPTHRRIIHVEFAAEELPDGLRWIR